MKVSSGVFYLLLAELLFGTSAFSYKLMATSIPGNLVVAIRYGIGSIVLLLWLAAHRGFSFKKQTLNWKTYTAIVFLGTLGLGISSVWYVNAVRNIGVVLGSLLTNLEIPLGILFGYWVLGEKITKTYAKTFGVIGIGFLLLTVKNGITLPPGGSYIVGIMEALAAAMTWGACTVIGKKLITHWRPTQVVFIRSALGSLTNLCILAASGASVVSLISTITFHDWIILLWLGIAVSGLGFVLFYKGLEALEVKKASLLFLTSSVVSVLLGLVTRETPLWTQWVGIALIMGGLFFMFRTKDVI